MKKNRKWSAGSVSSLLLLEDFIEGVSPAAAGRLALLASVLLHRAPPGRRLDPRPPSAAGGAGRGGGREDEGAVGSVGRDAEGAGGAGGGQDGGRAPPQLPEAGALLQASSSPSSTSFGPGALALQGVEPGRKMERLGAVKAS